MRQFLPGMVGRSAALLAGRPAALLASRPAVSPHNHRSQLLYFSHYPSPKCQLPRPELNLEFYTDPTNTEAIRQNIVKRRAGGDIDTVIQLKERLSSDPTNKHIERELEREVFCLPNMSHPGVGHLTQPRIVLEKEFRPPDHKLRPFEDISRIIGGARLQNLGHFSGERTYYLTGPLAELEHALVRWSVNTLLNKGFELMSVPDILHPDIINRCGMEVEGERTQVYKLDKYYGQAALSGTSEMALGGFLMGKRLDKLPLKLCAVSRCFRAEISQTQQEKGLYRVHQFTKVEMFVVTEGADDKSEAAMEEVHAIEREMFDSLGLSYRVLDMSPDELGPPAARKYDVEAWLPGRQGGFWGEISSCSNCTDYQARRLDIRDLQDRFCHTVNGTACAVPRMIIAICEQFQQVNGSVTVPEVLRPFLRNQEVLAGRPRKQRPNLLFLNSANYFHREKN